MRYGDDRSDDYADDDDELEDELEYVDDDELDDLYRRTSSGGRTGFSGSQGSSSRLPGSVGRGGSSGSSPASRLPGNVGRSAGPGSSQQSGSSALRRGVSNFARDDSERGSSPSPPPRRGTGPLSPSSPSSPRTGTGPLSSSSSRTGTGPLSPSSSSGGRGSSGDDRGKSSGGGRFGNPLSRGKKNDDRGKSSGGGRLSNPLSRGKKDDDRGKSSSGGRFGNPLSRGKKDDSSRGPGGYSGGSSSSSSGGRSLGLPGRGGDKKSGSGGGIKGKLGGLRRGGKKDDRSASSRTSSMPASSGVGSRPQSSGVSGGASSGGRAALGSRTQSQAASGVAGGLRSRLPFGGGDKADKAERPRTQRSKAPRVQSEGLSLDTKLDILGVVLVFASLALFLSILSPNRGSLTGSLNEFISQAFGWGKLAFPVAMFAVGAWLIKRHFGEEAPTLELTRVIGLFVGFLGVLTLFQFIDSFGYSTLSDLRTLEFELDLAWMDRHAGGGWIGAQLYYLMVVNVGEIESFVVLLGWLVISLMLVLSLSFAELMVVTVSIWRSLHDSIARRAQRRAARQVASQAAIPALSISRPNELASAQATAELPGGAVAGALPAPAQDTPPEERQIPITAGGRTFTATLEGSEPVPVGAAEGQQESGGGRGGRFGRVLGGIPLVGGGGSSTPDQPSPVRASAATTNGDSDQDAEETNGKKSRFGGRLRPSFLSRGSSNGDDVDSDERLPDEKLPVTAQATPSPAVPTSRTPGFVSDTNGEDRPARVGDLLRQNQPAASHSASPAAPPRLGNAQPPRPTTPIAPTARPGSPSSDDDESGDAPARRGGLWRNRIPFGSKSDNGDDVPDEDTDTTEDKQTISTTTTPAAHVPAVTETEPDLARPSAAASVEEELSKMRPARPTGTMRTVRGEEVDSEDRATPRIGGIAQRPGAPRPDAAQRAAHLDSIRGRPMPTREGRPVNRDEDDSDKDSQTTETPVVPTAASQESTFRNRPAPVINRVEEDSTAVADKPAEQESQATQEQPAASQRPATKQSAVGNVRPTTPPMRQPTVRTPKKDWQVPNTSELLMSGSDQDIDREFLLERARTIEDTLQSFGAPGRVVEVNTGPVITQFGVEPNYLVARSGKRTRVKVGAIAQLDKDLQLALGAKSIRVEAPVPGKGYVGIEVPNAEPALVSLRDVMESNEFQRIDSPLTIALGQSVDGTPVAADLTAMPHLLIAGTTGSGKSVLVNAVIASLLIRNRPDHVKLIMVDPKRVELTGYNGIPHLVAPVVVELERIVGVLKWVTHEMDNRYKRFSNAQARNIVDFNNHLPAGEEHMPYIVVIIDELADLMMLAPDETERVITRIAALARATGIHLVIATQRPSVDVVTGLIKANFPARIAFAVAGGVDSRVILDQPGAERLLGRGDMLYLSGNSPAPVRLQGVFVSDIEINNIARYWATQLGDSPPPAQLKLDLDPSSDAGPPSFGAQVNAQSQSQSTFWNAPDDDEDSGLGIGADNGVDDDLYETSVELVRRLDKASVSLLQRRLRIGYTRAARLIDAMEEYGVIGPAESGSKPREVLPMDD